MTDLTDDELLARAADLEHWVAAQPLNVSAGSVLSAVRGRIDAPTDGRRPSGPVLAVSLTAGFVAVMALGAAAVSATSPATGVLAGGPTPTTASPAAGPRRPGTVAGGAIRTISATSTAPSTTPGTPDDDRPAAVSGGPQTVPDRMPPPARTTPASDAPAPPAASPAPPTTNAPTAAPLLAIGSRITLASVDQAGQLVRHQNFRLGLWRSDGAATDVDRQDASFVVRDGLGSRSGVSLESVNFPGAYVRVSAGAVQLVTNDGTAGFAGDATFVPRRGLAGIGVSLELLTDPGFYLHHRDFLLWAGADNGSLQFAGTATFSWVPAIG